MITVRPAVPDDAARIVDIRNAGWREAYAHLLSPQFLANLANDADAWREGLARAERRSVTVVAELDGEVVGFAHAGPAVEDDAPCDWCLAMIYQYSRAHGSGTGAALLDAAVGDRPAYLWTAEGNPRALAFYRRNGFTHDGARKTIPEWENMAAIRMVRQ